MSMHQLCRSVLPMFSALALLAGCATFRPAAGAPKWVTTTPSPSGGYTYFVGSGSDPNGNVSNANEDAAHSLLADVGRYLGVKIDSTSTVETSGDLKEVETKISESIQESSSAHVGDFTVADRWIQQDGHTITVFLLGKYLTSALLDEKASLAAAAKERTDAVGVPELDGDALAAKGDSYRAAVQYLHAAMAATSPGIVNADVKFQRNAKKAIDAIQRVHVRALNDNLTGFVDQPLPSPFQLRVTSSNGSGDAPLSGVPFIESYKVLRQNGRTAVETAQVSSESGGVLQVTRPAPSIIGPDTIDVAMDLTAELTPLQALPDRYQSLVAAIQNAAAGVHATLHYSATSEASTIPTAVLVLDLDRGGGWIPGDDAASGVMDALTRSGYSLTPITSNASVVGIDDSDLISIVRNNYGSTVQRVVLGTARISSFDQSGGAYMVQVTGTVKVAELSTGKIIFSSTQVKSSRASGEASAIGAAFKGLGESIGQQIADTLH